MLKLTSNFPIFLLCSLALILTLTNCDCVISNYPRKTTVGYIHADLDPLYSSQNRPQIYSYPLIQQIKDTLLARTAIAVNGFRVERKNNQFGYKIEYAFPKKDFSSVIFTVTMEKGSDKQNTNQWVFIQFNFIVTETPQIIGSTRDIQYALPTSTSQNYKISEKIYVPNDVKFKFKAKPKIFISGISFVEKNTLSKQSLAKIQEYINVIKMLRKYAWNQVLLKRFTFMVTTQKDPNIVVSEPQFDQSNTINFEIKVSQVSIKQFSFSYLIYLQRNNENIYQIMDGSFITTDQEKYLLGSTTKNEMNIYGINGIRFASQFVGTFSLSIQQNLKDPNPYLLATTKGDNAQFMIQYFAISTLPGAVCLTCPGSPLIYEEFCVAECPPGYVSGFNKDSSLQCIKCDIQNLFLPDQSKQTCVCANGHYLIAPTKTCNPCPYDCLTCNGNKCLTCDSPGQSSFRSLNVVTGRCDCLLINSFGRGVYDDSANQNRKCKECNIRCQTCKGPQHNDCLTCHPSRVFMNGICKCGQNFIQNEKGQCTCDIPYSLNQAGKCILTSNKCLQNQILIFSPTRACICKAGYIRSSFSNKCIKQCQSYEQLNQQTQTCECRKGFIRHEVTSICYSCSSKLNQIYNQQTKKCECLSGFEMNRAGECSMCPSRTYYNNKTDKCECIFNYYKPTPNSLCMKCKSQNDNSSCKTLSSIVTLEL